MTITDTLARDTRHALRSLRRDLGTCLLVVAIAGIGIGASTTVFSICRALLLRPLPFKDPEHLVWIANGTSENLSAQTTQVNNLLDLRTQSRSFVDIAGYYEFYAPGDVHFAGDGEPERLTGVPVTQSFFELLGVRPLAGRFFNDEESRVNAPKTVVLGYDFWRRRFGSDRGIIGRAIVLDDAPVTVIGILPESFDFSAMFTPGRSADVFFPFPLAPETNRRGNTLGLIGRLRNSATLNSAQREATQIAATIKRGLFDGVWRNGFNPNLMTLRERVSGKIEPALLVLSAAVGFLMLLVCANLSNLLLVRASTRAREMAVRSALGAQRRELVRQLLVESCSLAVSGAVLGVLLAIGGTYFVARIQGTTVPLLAGVHVDTTVLGFSVLIAVATGIGFGLVPALHGTSFNLATALAEGTRGSSEGRGSRLRRTLVVVEVALVCVMLTGAGLLMRSLRHVLEVQPGFAADHLTAVRVDPRAAVDLATKVAYFDAVVREVSALPGVQSVGLTDALPLGDNFGWRRWSISTPDLPESDKPLTPLVRMVDEGYFAAMQIPLREGRPFDVADAHGEPVIILNEQLARTLWPGKDPIGREVKTSRVTRRVIGVVRDVRYFGLDREPDMEMYMPLRTGDFQTVDLVIRSPLPPTTLASSVRAALHRIDPSMPIPAFRTMDELLDRSTFVRRFVVSLVGGFALFGLLLAALGIYGVIAYAVLQRQQEIGIRMALGATPAVVRRSIMRQTGSLVLLGAVYGLPVAFFAGRAIRSLLYDVRSSDPMTFGAVAAVLGLVAALAGYLPAFRASRVDPAEALRR